MSRANQWRRLPGTLLISLVFGAPAAVQAENPTQTLQELETVRAQIKAVEQNLAETREQTDRLHEELERSELQTASALQQLESIRSQIEIQHKSLETLSVQQARRESKLHAARQQLSRQLRATWQLGRNNHVKLLLNQEESERVSRMLTLHTFHGRARARQIKTLHRELNTLDTLRIQFSQQSEILSALQAKQENKLRDYVDFHASRQAIIGKLQAHLQKQDLRLRALRDNERELSELFYQLGAQPFQETGSHARQLATLPSFQSLKGALDWPLPGRLLKHFGQTRHADSALKWSGVLLDAMPGDTVRTISTGRVIYADWFRGFGLLMIVDHGQGYMSLYGYNQKLLKKTGDWVLAGENIARVGDSEQSHPGLYFELRKDSVPINPAQWCKTKAFESSGSHPPKRRQHYFALTSRG